MSLPLFTPNSGHFKEWLDGLEPDYPDFDRDGEIQGIVLEIKGPLFDKIIEGCEAILDAYPSADTRTKEMLDQSIKVQEPLWKAVIAGHKYGVVYLCSRVDAASHHKELRECPSTAYFINEYLSENSLANRAINYGIRLYLHDEPQLMFATTFIPRYAIGALESKTLVVRESDINEVTLEKALTTPNAIYDLHDFAHMTTATLNEILYGNKYHSSLSLLRKEHTRLITSPGMRDLTGPLISDGIIFSEFLTGIFTQQVNIMRSEQYCTYERLTEVMATLLTEYLIGERKLLHPTTGMLIQNPQLPTPHQLAVLAQNKAYELPASEMEQKFFTRGGPTGDNRDELEALDPLERVEALAHPRVRDRWLYFEVRNTIKHRAQSLAYSLVAKELIRRGEDEEICNIILASLTFEDARNGRRMNLWNVVSRKEWYADGPKKMSSKDKWDIVNARAKKDDEGKQCD